MNIFCIFIIHLCGTFYSIINLSLFRIQYFKEKITDLIRLNDFSPFNEKKNCGESYDPENKIPQQCSLTLFSLIEICICVALVLSLI